MADAFLIEYAHGDAFAVRIGGRLVGGGGVDRDGAWSWWSARTGGRRQPAASRDEAIDAVARSVGVAVSGRAA